MTPNESFNQALAIVLADEGGLVDDPDDHGGISHFGITLPELTAFYGYPATPEMIRGLTVEVAGQIYRKLYWDVLFLDQVNPAEAAVLFDMAVLRGTGGVTRDVQQILNLVVDGKMGAKTLATLDVADLFSFVIDFIGMEQDHFVKTVTGDPTQVKFLQGWFSRSQRLLKRALTMGEKK